MEEVDDDDGDCGDHDDGDEGDLYNPRLIPASAYSPRQAARPPKPLFPHPPWRSRIEYFSEALQA